jgi:urea carboxylase
MIYKVKSHVAGQVWKTVAKVGDQLAADDVIAIVECMKMEIPVVAPVAGTLVELCVAEEDIVAEDQDIAVVQGV